MHESKRNVGLMAFSYLLGIITAALALEGLGLVRGAQVPALVLAGAAVALLLAAAGLGWALWVLTAGRALRPAPRPALRRRRPQNVDLPTVTDYYENASDGVLPAPAPAYLDLDPASDPRLADGVGA
jgi:hypothetical protein